MDLQNTLTKIANILIDKRYRPAKAWVHRPDLKLNFYTVIVNTAVGARGSSTSKGVWHAFLKAMAECGESLLCFESGDKIRTGLTGGILSRSQTIDRGKAELIEKDALLWHYQNQIPWNQCENLQGDILSFRLANADTDYVTVLVTDKNSCVSESAPFLYGLGSQHSYEQALKRALAEYEVMRLNHSLQFNGVEIDWGINYEWSRHPKNKEIIKKLSQSLAQNFYRDQTRLNWTVKEKKSPIYGYHFYQLKNPELIPMRVAEPEPNQAEIIYHPFWS